ncbi:MAG: ankyrin repeat domain-containing protein [Gemmatimonadota bacterium]|nr:ankyrin repeat domain-containing protein [Gemmatimonadota bacterium]
MNRKFRVNVLGALLATLLVTAGSTDSPVADAAQRGDVEAVVALLEQGADVNAAQGDGMTALHWAARKGNAELAEVLLYAGASTEATTRLGGYTALHLASRSRNERTVETLLEHGADAGNPTATGARALHLAAEAGDSTTVSVLLENGAEVDAREDVYDQTPLIWATANNRVEAMRTLLDAGADVKAQTAVVDYALQSELDRVDRQRRNRIQDARIEAEREAQTEREARLAEERAEEEGEQNAVASEPANAEEDEPAEEEESEGEEEGASENEDAADSEEESEAEAAEEEEQEETAEDEEAPEEEEDESEESEADLEPLGYSDLVGKEGGLTPLHYAARDGYAEAAELLLSRGADVNQPSGDGTTPLLMATINGNYDLAVRFLEEGADPNLDSEDGATPLFTTLNNRWAPKALFPQPTAFKQQRTDYLEMMEALLDAGADPNHRTKRHIWYTSYNFDLLGVDFVGATPFWRAAYALDVSAMKLLVEHGADPTIPTRKPASRRYRGGGDEDEDEDPSGLPPAKVGGPAVYPIHAASGVGFGEGFAANSHRHAPDQWVPAVRYLVEELGADVNARDHNGYSPVHHAAARGDNELIEYLVSQGADVTLVSRDGETTVDLANSPVQRISPFPKTIDLLESLGAKNNNNCAIC